PEAPIKPTGIDRPSSVPYRRIGTGEHVARHRSAPQLDTGGNATEALSRSALAKVGSRHLIALSTYQHRQRSPEATLLSRGRSCLRRPLAPPYMRFRIRRFIKHAGSAAGYR